MRRPSSAGTGGASPRRRASWKRVTETWIPGEGSSRRVANRRVFTVTFQNIEREFNPAPRMRWMGFGAG